MRVLGYTWAGVRTANLKSTTRFFADVLGLSAIHKGEGLVQFEMLSGQLFEVFGSKSRYYQLHACPVLAFQVEDVRAARKELESRGVQFVTDVAGKKSEAWTYFRGPDGYLYELWQTARPLKELPPSPPSACLGAFLFSANARRAEIPVDGCRISKKRRAKTSAAAIIPAQCEGFPVPT